MKYNVITAAVALVLAGSVSAIAEPLRQYNAGPLPPYEAVTAIRSMGFQPVERPIWRDGRYHLRAYDNNGRQVRVVLDAYSGQVLAVRAVPVDYDRSDLRERERSDTRNYRYYRTPDGDDRDDDDDDDDASSRRPERRGSLQPRPDDLTPLPPRVAPPERRGSLQPSTEPLRPAPKTAPTPTLPRVTKTTPTVKINPTALPGAAPKDAKTDGKADNKTDEKTAASADKPVGAPPQADAEKAEPGKVIRKIEIDKKPAGEIVVNPLL